MSWPWTSLLNPKTGNIFEYVMWAILISLKYRKWQHEQNWWMAIMNSLPNFCFGMVYVISRAGGVVHSNSHRILPWWWSYPFSESLGNPKDFSFIMSLCYMQFSLNHFLLDGNWLLWAVPAFTPVTRESFMCLLHYFCSTGTCFPFFPQLIVLESCMEVTFLMDFGIVSMSQLYFLWIWSELYFLWISQHANKSKQCKQREGPNHRPGWWKDRF